MAMITNILAIVILSIITVILMDYYFTKKEAKRVSRLDNKVIPRRVYINKSVGTHSSDIKKAIKYINKSLDREVYSLVNGKSELSFVSRSDVLVPISGEGLGTIAFSVAEQNFICLTKKLDHMDQNIVFLLIVHELLHDLGFDHQPKSVDSLLNEGPVLISKLYSKPLFLVLTTKKMPPHDIQMIKKQYF